MSAALQYLSGTNSRKKNDPSPFATIQENMALKNADGTVAIAKRDSSHRSSSLLVMTILNAQHEKELHERRHKNTTMNYSIKITRILRVYSTDWLYNRLSTIYKNSFCLLPSFTSLVRFLKRDHSTSWAFYLYKKITHPSKSTGWNSTSANDIVFNLWHHLDSSRPWSCSWIGFWTRILGPIVLWTSPAILYCHEDASFDAVAHTSNIFDIDAVLTIQYVSCFGCHGESFGLVSCIIWICRMSYWSAKEWKKRNRAYNFIARKEGSKLDFVRRDLEKR